VKLDDFWKYTKQSGRCLLWTRAKSGEGYGNLHVGDKLLLAHRVAYMLCVGKIPRGMKVLHNCDNPSCVNPVHLRLGNTVENAMDCVKRGRHHFASRDRCKNGHIYTKETTRLWIQKNGSPRRYCRACERIKSRKRCERRRLISCEHRAAKGGE